MTEDQSPPERNEICQIVNFADRLRKREAERAREAKKAKAKAKQGKAGE